MKGFAFWAGYGPQGFNLTKPILFHYPNKDLCYYLLGSLVPSVLARELHPSCAHYESVLVYILIFSSQLHHKQQLVGGLCWYTVGMFVSLPNHKHIEIQRLAHALLQRQPVTIHQVMSFVGRTTFCANGPVQICQLCCVMQSEMLNVYHSPTHLFLSFHLSHSALHQLQGLSQL